MFDSSYGPCAKATVTCTITAADGQKFVGQNICANPQSACPREPGEGYEKCQTVCKQVGHAEVVATMLAGEKAKGANAELDGHTYACMNCQHTMFGAGVRWFSVKQKEAQA